MKILCVLILRFMILKVKRVVSQSLYARQDCFKGRSAKEIVIMDSFVERLYKIHENTKARFF